MLDTINNMLATHSTIQQRENKSLEPDRKSSDKFSDHVSAADDQSQKERKKPDEVSRNDDNDQVDQKQSTDKPSRKNETEDSSEANAEGAGNASGEEQEVDFETALLLLNEIQDVVEDDVEFLQTTTDETAGVLEENAQVGETQLGALGESLGEDTSALQASDLPGEVKNALQNGEQQGDAGDGELVSDEDLSATPKDFQQTGDQDKGQGKKGPAAVTPLERTGKNDGLRDVDAGKNSNGENLIDGEEGELLGKEQDGTKGAENSEGKGEQKVQARLFNAQAQASQNAANSLHGNGAQADAGLSVIQNNQNANAASQLNMAQGLANSQQTQQVPVNNVALQIAARAQNGAKRFDIQLDPPELGRIDVRLDVGKDGSVNTHIAVERSETLDLMQRDARALEKALNEAGLNMKEGNLQFSLKEEGFQGEGFEFEDQANGADDEDDEIQSLNMDIEHVMNLYRQSGGATGLDIRV